ncbi:MAG: hypothetical protein GXO26_01855 [Crenarchaeota archaeon]|nr:hypothetical protein [Thermoproteota archaeon]
MSSLSRRLANEIFKIINLADIVIDFSDIVRFLEKHALLEPLLELHYRTETRVPILIHPMYGITIPIAIVQIPLPEHRAVIFYSPTSNNISAISEGQATSPLQLIPDAVLDLPFLSTELLKERKQRLTLIEELTRELGLVEPLVQIIEEVERVLPPDILEFVKVNPIVTYKEYPRFLESFKQYLETGTFSKKDKEKLLNFLRNFPGIGYERVNVGGSSLYIPDYLHLNIPCNRNVHIMSNMLRELEVGYNPILETVTVLGLGNYIVYRPTRTRKQGYIIDLLPSEEATRFLVEKSVGEKYPLRLYAKYTVPHPFTGEELLLYLYKVPREKTYILLY